MSVVHLVVPGLLAPLPGASPRLPVVERSLARADWAAFEGDDPAGVMLCVAGIRAPAGGDPPVGALSLLGEGRDPGRACWLRATPVHLRPDRDRLLLLDTTGFAPERSEADALVEMFNRHFAADGLTLEAPHPSRWYLRVAACPALRTRSLGEALGRSPDGLLPSGPDSARWRALLNETQMLFHGAGVNASREARGVPALNGLWLDGAGVLPEPPVEPLAAAQGDAPLMAGIARLSGAECGPVPESPGRLPPADAGVMVLYERILAAVRAGDDARRRAELEAFERWIAPLVQALGGCPGAQLRIYPVDGRVIEVGRRALGRFWRRSRPLSRWVPNRSPTTP
ncbi:MAG: phosphoglycerate mutase [Chromatiales bacterium]|jgi:hypothetical protein